MSQSPDATAIEAVVAVLFAGIGQWIVHSASGTKSEVDDFEAF